MGGAETRLRVPPSRTFLRPTAAPTERESTSSVPSRQRVGPYRRDGAGPPATKQVVSERVELASLSHVQRRRSGRRAFHPAAFRGGRSSSWSLSAGLRRGPVSV